MCGQLCPATSLVVLKFQRVFICVFACVSLCVCLYVLRRLGLDLIYRPVSFHLSSWKRNGRRLFVQSTTTLTIHVRTNDVCLALQQLLLFIVGLFIP